MENTFLFAKSREFASQSSLELGENMSTGTKVPFSFKIYPKYFSLQQINIACYYTQE